MSIATMTPEERRAYYREKTARWRAANLERYREIVRQSMKRVSDAKAIAAGREPGQRGRAPTLTAEEKRAKRAARSRKHYAEHPEALEKAKVRQKAKRAGTFVSQALPRLTEEQRLQRGKLDAGKRRARLRGNGGETVTPQMLTFLRFAQRDRCAFCMEPLGTGLPHLDHHRPVADGGEHAFRNLRLLHETCNLRKGDIFPHLADRAMSPAMQDW